MSHPRREHPGNAVDQLAAALANSLALAHGPEALREGLVDCLGLTSPVGRLALRRALARQVPGFGGLLLDGLPDDGLQEEGQPARRAPPPPPPLGSGDLERFLARVLPRPGPGGAPGAPP